MVNCPCTIQAPRVLGTTSMHLVAHFLPCILCPFVPQFLWAYLAFVYIIKFHHSLGSMLDGTYPIVLFTLQQRAWRPCLSPLDWDLTSEWRSNHTNLMRDWINILGQNQCWILAMFSNNYHFAMIDACIHYFQFCDVCEVMIIHKKI